MRKTCAVPLDRVEVLCGAGPSAVASELTFTPVGRPVLPSDLDLRMLRAILPHVPS